KPELEIDAGPKVNVRAVETKVSKKLLKRYVPVFQERTVDNDLLVEGARNLRDYFETSGYPDVDVTFRMRDPSPNERVIEYVISKGPRKKLANVEIVGNKYFRTDTIRERLFVQPSALWFRHGRYSDALRRRDQEAIEALYKSNGFRDVQVS